MKKTNNAIMDGQHIRILNETDGLCKLKLCEAIAKKVYTGITNAYPIQLEHPCVFYLFYIRLTLSGTRNAHFYHVLRKHPQQKCCPERMIMMQRHVYTIICIC